MKKIVGVLVFLWLLGLAGGLWFYFGVNKSKASKPPTTTADALAPQDSTTPQGPVYYVAADGSDANMGTSASPFASIQHAVDQAIPGGTVYIRGGTYRQTITLDGLAGTPDLPITLTPYEDERVVIDGTVEIASDWTLDAGKVYKTTVTDDVTQLFVDGEPMTLARFPNALAFSDYAFNGCAL
jgi:hypothetical protein